MRAIVAQILIGRCTLLHYVVLPPTRNGCRNESQERLKEREEVRERKAQENAARGEAAAARRKANEVERNKKLREQTAKREERDAKAKVVREKKSSGKGKGGDPTSGAAAGAAGASADSAGSKVVGGNVGAARTTNVSSSSVPAAGKSTARGGGDDRATTRNESKTAVQNGKAGGGGGGRGGGGGGKGKKRGKKGKAKRGGGSANSANTDADANVGGSGSAVSSTQKQNGDEGGGKGDAASSKASEAAAGDGTGAADVDSGSHVGAGAVAGEGSSGGSGDGCGGDACVTKAGKKKAKLIRQQQLKAAPNAAGALANAVAEVDSKTRLVAPLAVILEWCDSSKGSSGVGTCEEAIANVSKIFGHKLGAVKHSIPGPTAVCAAAVLAKCCTVNMERGLHGQPTISLLVFMQATDLSTAILERVTVGHASTSLVAWGLPIPLLDSFSWALKKAVVLKKDGNVAAAVCRLVVACMSHLARTDTLATMVSYTASLGIFRRLRSFFGKVHGDAGKDPARLIYRCLTFISYVHRTAACM